MLRDSNRCNTFQPGLPTRKHSAWEQREFSELASLRRGLTYSPADVRPYGQGVRVLRSSNIAEDEFVLSREDVFVDKDVVKIDLAQDDEILITAANGSPRLVGKRAKIHDLAGKQSMVGSCFALARNNRTLSLPLWGRNGTSDS